MPEPSAKRPARAAGAPRRPAAAAPAPLERRLAELGSCPPDRRIDLREPILAHGLAAVAPLADLAGRQPDLGPAATAWLEVLAQRDVEARQPVLAALRGFLSASQEDTRRHASEALARLGAPVSAAQARRAAATQG